MSCKQIEEYCRKIMSRIEGKRLEDKLKKKKKLQKKEKGKEKKSTDAFAGGSVVVSTHLAVERRVHIRPLAKFYLVP